MGKHNICFIRFYHRNVCLCQTAEHEKKVHRGNFLTYVDAVRWSSLCILQRTPFATLSATWVSWRYVGATLHMIPLNILNPSSYWIMCMYDQSNLMCGLKPSYLKADFRIRTLSVTCVGSVPVMWTKCRSYRHSPPTQRRLNSGKNGGRTMLQCRLNGGTTATRPHELHFQNLISYVPVYCTYGLIQDLAVQKFMAKVISEDLGEQFAKEAIICEIQQHEAYRTS